MHLSSKDTFCYESYITLVYVSNDYCSILLFSVYIVSSNVSERLDRRHNRRPRTKGKLNDDSDLAEVLVLLRKMVPANGKNGVREINLETMKISL